MEIKPVKKYNKPSFLTAAVAAVSLLSACTTRTTGIVPMETEDLLLDGDVIMEYSETETSESATDTSCTDSMDIEITGEIPMMTAPDETDTVTSAETTTASVTTTAAITTAATTAATTVTTTVTSQITTAETDETDEPCLELEGDVIVDYTDDIEYIVVDTPGEAPVDYIDIPEEEPTLAGEIDVMYMDPNEYVRDAYEEMNVEMTFDGWSSHTLTIAKDTTVQFDYISTEHKIMLIISDPSMQSTYEELSKKYKKITKTDFGYVFEGKEDDTLYTGVVIISSETEEELPPKLKASVDYLMEIKVI